MSRDWLVNGNNITVTGNVDARRAGTVNIFSSQDFFMHTFMERLQARGIRCIPAAEAEVSYLFGEFRQDSLSVRMASYETSVQDVVKQIMKESDKAELDYIHEEDTERSLGALKGNMGFILSPMSKDELFKSVILDGPLPRKTFSMGNGRDKRYYLEARRIKP